MDTLVLLLATWLMNGKGIYRYASGAVFKEDFLDDKKHGKGVFLVMLYMLD